MPVLIDLFSVIQDEWARLDDDQPLGNQTYVVLSVERIRRFWSLPSSVNRIAGVALDADDEVDEIAAWLPHLALVSLHFESFADGRAFSQARLLRTRHGFRGIICARGQVVRDQLAFMQRCGFNQFELAPGEEVAEALRAFTDISLSYQPEIRQAASA